MRPVSPMALSVAALLQLAACAQAPVWNKQGGSATAFEQDTFAQDTAACFRNAAVQAQGQSGDQGAAAPQIELHPSQGGRVHDTTAASRKAVSQQENVLRNRLYAQCMHRLGYRRAQP
ncbi:MAG: hypothetical protein O2967_16305 [Proteobacteria bacterium]|nr:hypothetical protein [Pseudomonadota bacterium]